MFMTKRQHDKAMDDLRYEVLSLVERRASALTRRHKGLLDELGYKELLMPASPEHFVLLNTRLAARGQSPTVDLGAALESVVGMIHAPLFCLSTFRHACADLLLQHGDELLEMAKAADGPPESES